MLGKSYDNMDENELEKEIRINKMREEFEQLRLSNYTDKFKIRRNKDITVQCIPTGYSKLDSKLDGLLSSTITNINSGPFINKSDFLFQMIIQILNNNIDIIYFSYYLSECQYMIKSDLLSNYLDYNIEIIEEHLNFIDCTLNQLNINDIADIVNKLVKKNEKLPIVFIDNINQICSPILETGECMYISNSQLLQYNLREIRKLCSTHKIPIVLISELDKHFKSIDDMRYLNGVSSLDNVSDVIISLEYSNISNELDLNYEQSLSICDITGIITKNRYGQVGGKIKFNYYKRYGYFEEV